MKTMNNFQISGFVVNNATINQFATASIARFGLSVRRTEKIGDEEKKVSAILNIEAWKSNEAADAFNILTKGARVLVEGYFKPEEWTRRPRNNGLLPFLPGASVFGQGHHSVFICGISSFLWRCFLGYLFLIIIYTRVSLWLYLR